MQSNLTFLIFTVLMIFSMSSCNSKDVKSTIVTEEKTNIIEETEPVSKLFNDLFLPDSDNLFRGIDFDMSLTEIRKIEIARAACSEMETEKDNQLIITTNLGSEKLDFADLIYTFDEKGLYVIEVKTFLTTEEKSSYFFNNAKKYLTRNLGESTIAEDGYTEFLGNTLKYKYQVAMKEILIEGDETKLPHYGMYLVFSMK